METWKRLDQNALKSQRAVLRTGLDLRESELFLNRGFAFQSAAWWEASLIFVELSTVWRQKDADLVATLNRVRKGVMTPEDLRYLYQNCATRALPPAPSLLGESQPPPGQTCQSSLWCSWSRLRQ